jgi:hypothetical protein
MIHRYDSSRPVEVMPGLVRRMLAECNTMMICEFTLEKGVEIPVHSHPNEQVGYIASGRIKIIVDGESFELNPATATRPSLVCLTALWHLRKRLLWTRSTRQGRTTGRLKRAKRSGQNPGYNVDQVLSAPPFSACAFTRAP